LERQLSAPDTPNGKLMQIGWSGGCSKHEMLLMFRDAFRPDIVVTPVEHEVEIDRRLESDIEVPVLREQVAQLRRMVVAG
jgi:hypothetical protein